VATSLLLPTFETSKSTNVLLPQGPLLHLKMEATVRLYHMSVMSMGIWGRGLPREVPLLLTTMEATAPHHHMLRL
jgi:hypothetical protein